MIQKFSFLGLAAGALFAGALGASAATLDFTNNAAYTTQTTTGASGTFLTVGWTVTPTPGTSALTYTSYDGGQNVAALAEQNDGIGIEDDEVTFPAEALTLTFAKNVIVTGLHFLDLFVGKGIESVSIFDGASNLLATVLGTDITGTGQDGYAFKGVNLVGKTFVFKADSGNEPVGAPDFALAAIDVKSSDGSTPDPIPLPAGGVLLVTALAGLALARRRAKA